jgi:hypothetical protein
MRTPSAPASRALIHESGTYVKFTRRAALFA